MNDEEMEMICFQIISLNGDAKSSYLEALQQAKLKNYERANELLKEGKKSFTEGHHFHTKLIQAECSGNKIQMTLLLTHAEDQMMSVEVIKCFAEELIELYQKIDN